MRVLLVEDDRTIGAAVRDHIAAAGHGVDWAQDLATARDYLAVAVYQMVLLDLGLPDGNGIDLLRDIKRKGDTVAVMILSARDQIAARIAALNAGADDYLTKPFDLAELSARVAAVSRRYGSQRKPELRFGLVTLDSSTRIAARDGVPVALSAREWAVVERLARASGALVAKSAIEDTLYAFGAEVESNTVEVYISRLRKKLGHGLIRTVRGLGYGMAEGEG